MSSVIPCSFLPSFTQTSSLSCHSCQQRFACFLRSLALCFFANGKKQRVLVNRSGEEGITVGKTPAVMLKITELSYS